MERCPIHTTLMTLQHIFYSSHKVRRKSAKHRTRTSCLARNLLSLLFESRYIPDTNCLVQRCTHNEIFLWMELSTHHIVIMSRQHRDTFTTLPVPDPDVLVIRTTHNPRVFVMELDSTNIIQMAHQCEERSFVVVIPDTYLVVIASRHKKWLRRVKVDTSHWSIVLAECFQ